MKTNKKLLDLTNKFLKEFSKIASEEEKNVDDLYAFNMILPEVIGKSDYPKYKEKDYACLMGMSSFDDAIAKVFFNNRIQGFIGDVERRLENTEEQEDYLVENIVNEPYQKKEKGFDWDYDEKVEMKDFKTYDKFVDAEKISFDVRNTRSGFEGKAILYKKIKKHFSNENDFTEEMTSDEIVFYNKDGDKIMRIDTDSDQMERGTFTHYKHISDINSFFLILSCT